MNISEHKKIKFWDHVKKFDSCWEWTAGKTRDGYGEFRINAKDRSQRVHRISWFLHFGEIPKGLCVLHKCDNIPCVNPDHLWLGTINDNNIDRDVKGRNGYLNRIHCKNGHEYTKENTHRWNDTRICRKCRQFQERKLYWKKKGKPYNEKINI